MEFVNSAWILLGMFIIITISKVLEAEWSYKLKISLLTSIGGTLYFAIRFIILIDIAFNLWPLIFCVICCLFIYYGGKTVAFKTTTGVFSRITRKPIGHMNAGSFNWADPIFEKVTTSINGASNKSADLQELRIEIAETPLMQTKTRGIQVKIKKITFMLELTGDIAELFRIEGGAETIRERIVEYIDEFFLEKIGHTLPESLDQDKAKTIRVLAKKLKKEVNHFSAKNKYPYEIVSEVIIADTELEVKYYEVLAKKEFATLEADAQDVDANRLRERLLSLGSNLLPNSNEEERLKAALIALKITPQEIKKNIIGVSSEISILMKELVGILKH